MHVIPYTEFQGAQWFWNPLNRSGFVFCTGNLLERIQFFRLVLELFVNSEFFNCLDYTISSNPLFGFPISDKTLLQFCPKQS